jgi:crotonobetainyl-CoA:carnitine CoA-transferase CaiB-like acyl-CoA transferase
VDATLNGLGPLYRLYETADGWVFVAAPQPRDFERLCQGLDEDALARDERFATPEARARHAEALAEAISRALARRKADDWESHLTARGVACVRADQGPLSRWLFDRDWAARQGLVVDVEDAQGTTYRRYGAPVTNDRPVPLYGAADSGACTRALLAELGYSDAEIDRLVAERIVVEATA